MRRPMPGLLLLAWVASIGACEKYPTRPVNRRPVITSVIAFPTTLRLGDSTIVTVLATDPDGDTLVYDWSAYNGLAIQGDALGDGVLFHTHDRSRVFYLRRRPAGYDTAFISCAVRDVKGGGDSRRVLVRLQD